MIDLKLLNLNYGDSQKDLSDKLNYNFSQLISAGEGAYGPVGDIGPIGPNGSRGNTGPQGDQGFRGSLWFVQDEAPTSGATGGDYWIDLLNGYEVYKYVYSGGSYSWVSQGFVLSQSGVFTISTSQTGLTSGNPGSAYVQGLFAPEKRTLVLTDQTPENVKNPQLSKVVVGNTGVGITGTYPLLEFSKNEYQSIPDFNLRTPKFKWAVPESAGFGYSMIITSNDGLEIKSGGLKFTGYSIIQAGMYDFGSPFYGSGGLTGNFSGGINFSAQDEFYVEFGATSGTYPTTWDVQSANIPQWDNNILSAKTSFTAKGTSTVSGRNTFLVGGSFNYLRSKSYVTGENVLRMKYTGNPSLSSGGITVSELASDRDLYVVDSDGNNKYSKKISAFFPNPGLSGASDTGAFTHTATGISGNYYTVLATIDTTTVGSGKTYRFSIGDTYFMDYDGAAASSRALGIFLNGMYDTSGLDKRGFSALAGDKESYTFKIVAPNAANGFNAIFLDSTQFDPDPTTGAITFANSDRKFNFIDGDSNPSGYATVIEATMIRLSPQGNNWIIFWKAYGGNLDGIKCGCIRNSS
jgi:hypothetical protein